MPQEGGREGLDASGQREVSQGVSSPKILLLTYSKLFASGMLLLWVAGLFPEQVCVSPLPLLQEPMSMELKYQLPSDPSVYVDLLDDEDVRLMFDEVRAPPPFGEAVIACTAGEWGRWHG